MVKRQRTRLVEVTNSSPVQRFLLTARPTRNNRPYQPWETADICVFVKEADHQLALEKLDNLLEQQKAASQIRATKERLGLHNWRGGLILVNSGSYTIGAEKYFKLAKRYASKDTTQIQEVICMRR